MDKLESEKRRALKVCSVMNYSNKIREMIERATTIPSVDRALVTARHKEIP